MRSDGELRPDIDRPQRPAPAPARDAAACAYGIKLAHLQPRLLRRADVQGRCVQREGARRGRHRAAEVVLEDQRRGAGGAGRLVADGAGGAQGRCRPGGRREDDGDAMIGRVLGESRDNGVAPCGVAGATDFVGRNVRPASVRGLVRRVAGDQSALEGVGLDDGAGEGVVEEAVIGEAGSMRGDGGSGQDEAGGDEADGFHLLLLKYIIIAFYFTIW